MFHIFRGNLRQILQMITSPNIILPARGVNPGWVGGGNVFLYETFAKERLFMRKREDAGVKGEYFRRKANLKRILKKIELRTKQKVVRNFCLENEKFFRKI